jgi:RNA polymerase primary sigma factor
MPDDEVKSNDDQADPAAEDTATGDITEIEEPVLDDLVEEEEIDDETLNNSQFYDDISDDSVRLYLREIGKIPLLNSEEELELAQKVVAGDKRAKDKMAEANMRLVVSIAKRYSGRGLAG